MTKEEKDEISLKKVKNAQKCPKGNTDTLGQKTKRDRWFPSFTSYHENEPHYDADKMKYLIFGAEICPKTQRKHWQGAVYFYDKISIKMAQKYLKCEGTHMENIMKTTQDECTEYCKKDGNFKEFGSMPKQGRRTDLEAMVEDIKGGEHTDDIALNNPMMYHQYGRTLHKVEDIMMRKKWRKEMTKGIWYYGKTGVGKSDKAYEGYDPDQCYNWPNDKGWCDAYKQQDIVIINDFRGEIPYNTLLQLVDKHPYEVSRRGKEPLPFISKMVIITSSLHPELIYKNRNVEDSMEQFYRRFKVIELV